MLLLTHATTAVHDLMVVLLSPHSGELNVCTYYIRFLLANSLNMIFNASWSQRLQCRSLVFPSLLLLLLCLALLPSVSANTEKEIFVAPHEQDELLFTGANDGQSVELEALNLGLHKLTPSPLCGTSPCHNLKIALNTSFVPFEKQWVLLDHLKPGKRYEVRLCWAATVSAHSKGAICSFDRTPKDSLLRAKII